MSRSRNAGRSRNRWLVSRNSGVVPSIFERGSIRSIGSSWFPQLSHWSPRASRESANRAGSLDVAVGEGVAGTAGERAEHRLLEDEAVLVERPEQIPDDAGVVARRRPGEEVVAEPEIDGSRLGPAGCTCRPSHAVTRLRCRRRPSPACRARRCRTPSERRFRAGGGSGRRRPRARTTATWPM